MKQNTKGFTLIELLAVIVILAIVALIATPIILNVINDSRRKAAIDSTYAVVDAVKLAYTQNQLDSNAVDAKQTLTWPGTISIGGRRVSVSGDKPTEGSVYLYVKSLTENSKTYAAGTIVVSNLKFGSYYCNTYSNQTNDHSKVCCSISKGCTTDVNEN